MRRSQSSRVGDGRLEAFWQPFPLGEEQPGWLAVSAMISCLPCVSARRTARPQPLDSSGKSQLQALQKQYQLYESWAIRSTEPMTDSPPPPLVMGSPEPRTVLPGA